MRIEKIKNGINPSFKNLRTDKNEIATLKNGSMPILDNKKENILSALNRMASDSERKSIEFLMDVAENLRYGQFGNSEFRDMIDETTDISGKRENTDWAELLSDTIKQALSSADSDVSDLEAAYTNLFGTKTPLTAQQKDVLELRNQFKKQIVNQKSVEDADSLSLSAEVSQNIDFFIASSEISLDQKKECLEKLLYLLSDEYPINPQLTDKKLQIVNEMLHDLLIKVPGQEELTNKGVNQLYSGICAAISICRKAVAYEDKVRYIDIVLEELKDSPVMTVYDVTDLGSGKTVEIPKINIDYDSAIYQGYRILDASAHHWMQNAHSSGDGTIQSETYIAFDDDTYGVFNDSSWYEGFDANYLPEKELLQNLIKERELLNSVLKYRDKIQSSSQKILEAKKHRVEIQSGINGELNKTFAAIFPEMSAADITKLIRSIIKYYNGVQDTNEINVSEKMPDEVRQVIISDFIKEHTKTSSDDDKINGAIDNNSEKILGLIESYINEDKAVKKLSAFRTEKSQYAYYRKLYQLAAAHRMSLEADVNLDTGVIRFEKKSGLPPRTRQITSYLEKLSRDMEKPEIFSRFANGKTREDVQTELARDIIKIQSIIPNQLDDISKSLFDISIKDQTRIMLVDLRDSIKFGNSHVASLVASVSGLKDDRDYIIAYLDKLINKFEGSVSDDQIDEAIRILGFENRIHLFGKVLSNFISHLNSGISEEEMDALVERFGGVDNVTSSISEQQTRFNETINTYNDIISRWEVTSPRQLIIERMEKEQNILSRKKLDILRRKFDYIRSVQSQNDNIRSIKERKKANDGLYEFTNDELDILQAIERALPNIKKYSKTEYDVVNKGLFEELERQYADIGMLNGQFWVREEGSSGLSSNEQIRIIEQMTGKPYHIEHDIEKAVKQIKKGEGSGIISYSVQDDGYGFHAQYVPSVTSETLISPKTGEKHSEDILWTDNSWGKGEKDYFWNGRDGFKYTDYGAGYGWKNGFMLADDMRIGKSVSVIKTATGVEPKENDKFALFMDMVLEGAPIDAYQKLYKMFSYIFAMKQGEEYFGVLENFIKSGARLDTKNLEGLDTLVSDKTDNLNKQIEKIKTKEDYDKLPENSYLRYVLEAISVYMATNNPNLADAVLMAKTKDDLEGIKDDMYYEIIQDMSEIIAKGDKAIDRIILLTTSGIKSIYDEIKEKFNVEINSDQRARIADIIFLESDEEREQLLDGSLSRLEEVLLKQTEVAANENIAEEDARLYFVEQVQKLIKEEIDENMRIKSLDSPILANSAVKEEFIAAIDKYLSPTSDQELLDLIIALQYSDDSKADVFLSALDTEDVGLDFKDPYDYLLMLKNGNSDLTRVLGQIIASNIIGNELEPYKSEQYKYTAEDDEEGGNIEMTPADLYRSLYVKLADMDVQKYIRDFKAEAFRKYKVRQAFPQPVVIKDQEMGKICDEMFKYFEDILEDLNKDEFLIKVFDMRSELETVLNYTGISELMTNGESIDVKSLPAGDLDKILQILTSYSELLGIDTSLFFIKKPVDELIKTFSGSKSFIDGEAVAKSLNELDEIFASWEYSNTTRDRFIQNKKEGLAELRNNINILVRANVSPRYQNEAFERVNNIINMIKKGYNQEDIDYEKDIFIDFFLKRHILKDPTKLLSECVRMLQAGLEESQEYDVMKAYLIKSLKIAQQTKIQYQMVQNAHEGISSKLKDLLPLFRVWMEDGTSNNMNSEEGMIYLMNQLENSSDDYKTLKLFLAQSGLSGLSFDALINHFDMDKAVEIVDETYNQVMANIDEFEKLNSYFEEFRNIKKAHIKSLQDGKQYLYDFMTRKAKDYKDSMVFNKYLEYLNAISIKPEMQGIQSSLVLPVLYSLCEDAISYAGDSVNSQIDFIANTSQLLADRKTLVDVIDIPNDKKSQETAAEFEAKYSELHDSIQAKLDEIRRRIEGSPYMRAEIVED